jgi:hypothetical protein
MKDNKQRPQWVQFTHAGTVVVGQVIRKLDRDALIKTPSGVIYTRKKGDYIGCPEPVAAKVKSGSSALMRTGDPFQGRTRSWGKRGAVSPDEFQKKKEAADAHWAKVAENQARYGGSLSNPGRFDSEKEAKAFLRGDRL